MSSRSSTSITNSGRSLQDSNDRPAHAITQARKTKRKRLALRLRECTSPPTGGTMGVLSRYVASVRGEQCFVTINGRSEALMYRRGQQIVAGDRTFVVT